MDVCLQLCGVGGVHGGVEGDGRGGVAVSSSTSGAAPSSRLARVKAKEKKKLCLLCRHAHNDNSDGSEKHVLFRPSYIHIVVFRERRNSGLLVNPLKKKPIQLNCHSISKMILLLLD